MQVSKPEGEVNLAELIGAPTGELEGIEPTAVVEAAPAEPAEPTEPAAEPVKAEVVDTPVEEADAPDETPPAKSFLENLSAKVRAAVGGAKAPEETAHLRNENAQLTRRMLDDQASQISRLRAEADAEYKDDDAGADAAAEALLARRQAAASVFGEKFDLAPEAAEALVATISEFAKIESENQRQPELVKVQGELAEIQAINKRNEQYQVQFRTVGQGLVELANEGEKQKELVEDYAKRSRDSVLMRWYFKDDEAARLDPNAPLPRALSSVEAIVFHGNKLVKELEAHSARLGASAQGEGGREGDTPTTGTTQATAGAAITRPPRQHARNATEDQLNEVLGELDSAANESSGGLAELMTPF